MLSVCSSVHLRQTYHCDAMQVIYAARKLPSSVAASSPSKLIESTTSSMTHYSADVAYLRFGRSGAPEFLHEQLQLAIGSLETAGTNSMTA